jgi:hypothetical protein
VTVDNVPHFEPSEMYLVDSLYLVAELISVECITSRVNMSEDPIAFAPTYIEGLAVARVDESVYIRSELLSDTS